MSHSPRAPRVTAKANAVLADVGLLHNPYFEALRRGTMSLEAFRRSQEQFFFAVTFFPRPMAALVGRIPTDPSPHGLAVWPQPGRYSLGHTGNTR